MCPMLAGFALKTVAEKAPFTLRPLAVDVKLAGIAGG